MPNVSNIQYNGTTYGIEGVTDATLTISGRAADAAATGDAIDEVKEDLSDLPFVDVESSESMIDTTKLYRYDGALYYHNGTSWTEVGTGAGGSDITIVTYASEMTDTNLVYLYNGAEQGYTAGHWYYWNTGTSAWADGGTYQGWGTIESVIADNSVEIGLLTLIFGDDTYLYNGSTDVTINLANADTESY